jgi:hypothetical protein
VAVSKHLHSFLPLSLPSFVPSFLPSIISPTPSLYYNFPYSLLLLFPLGLEGINAHLSFSFPFSFLFSLTTTMGLSDHCLTLSGWGMTIAALGLAVYLLGSFHLVVELDFV